VGNQRDGRVIRSLDFSGDARQMAQCAPQYETLPGWQEDLRACRRWQDLPKNAKEYVRFIEEQSNLPVRNISVGPERLALISRS
jgi:adenylosuccinate synthase